MHIEGNDYTVDLCRLTVLNAVCEQYAEFQQLMLRSIFSMIKDVAGLIRVWFHCCQVLKSDDGIGTICEFHIV